VTDTIYYPNKFNLSKPHWLEARGVRADGILRKIKVGIFKNLNEVD
jgi:hypothetical protein